MYNVKHLRGVDWDEEGLLRSTFRRGLLFINH